MCVCGGRGGDFYFCQLWESSEFAIAIRLKEQGGGGGGGGGAQNVFNTPHKYSLWGD